MDKQRDERDQGTEKSDEAHEVRSADTGPSTTTATAAASGGRADIVGEQFGHHAAQNPAQPVGPAGQPTNRPPHEGHEGVTPVGAFGVGVSHHEGNPAIVTSVEPDQARAQEFVNSGNDDGERRDHGESGDRNSERAR